MAKIKQDLFTVTISTSSYVISYDGREVLQMNFMSHTGGKKRQNRLAIHELAERKIDELIAGKGHPEAMAIIYGGGKEVANG